LRKNIALCTAVAFFCFVFQITERNLHIRRGLFRFLASYALCYLLIVSMAYAATCYIGWRVQGLDLTGNGVLTSEKVIDPNASYLLRLDIQDTARTFIPFTAILLALFATGVGYVVGLAQRYVQRLLQAR
jgi:hypothetical protein